MKAIIEHQADWRGPSLPADLWLRSFSDEHLREIDFANRDCEARGLTLGEMTVEEFPLPTFDADIATMRDELQNGPGIQMYRGFPVRNYTKDQLRRIYWGISLHIGTAVAQSRQGDLIGDVRQLNSGIHDFGGRAYTSNEDLHFHVDGCDVAALFCLRVAKSGGLSRAVSVVAIHNEMARSCPDLLEILYQPFIFSWQGREAPGAAPDYEAPIFAVHQGKFLSRISPSYIRWGYEKRGLEMSSGQREALAKLMTLANDDEFLIEKAFEPGDMQFVNNLLLLHARTEFDDLDDPDEKRHLLRLWLSVPNSPALPDSFGHFFGNTEPGAVRGGYWSPPGLKIFETGQLDERQPVA